MRIVTFYVSPKTRKRRPDRVAEDRLAKAIERAREVYPQAISREASYGWGEDPRTAVITVRVELSEESNMSLSPKQQNEAAARQLREAGRAIDVDTLRQAMEWVGNSPDVLLDQCTSLQLATLVAAKYRNLFDKRATDIENEA